MNGFKFDHNSISPFSERDLVNGFKLGHPVSDHHDFGILQNGSNPPDLVQSNSPPDSSSGQDFNENPVLKYINQMLMEEVELERKPCMLIDCLALQAAEKSLYDVLGEKYPPSLDSPDDNFIGSCSSHISNTSTAPLDHNFIDPDPSPFESSSIKSSHVDFQFDSIFYSIDSSNSFFSDAGDWPVDSLLTPFQDQNKNNSKVVIEDEKNGWEESPDGLREKKSHYREESDNVEGGRSNKQLASYVEGSDEESDMYDKVSLICPDLNPLRHEDLAFFREASARNKLQKNGHRKGSNGGGRPRGSYKKQGNKKEMVDLSSLLTQCAHAVANTDIQTANELLSKIRQHSSPYGDGIERLAHFFANALRVRLAAGSGTSFYTAFASNMISAADVLKGYHVFVKACPFILLSFLFANRAIRKLSIPATRIHIIDFGILYGFQWPCLIQRLSERPGGPPKLRITGIEFPQPGFRPAERVEETGRRLAKICHRFKVPFEYNAIAKKWDTIQIEDLKINKDDEVLVVNCVYRLRNVPDDTVVTSSSPRDTVLNLIKRINPDLFVHGVLNGTYNAPFFVTRFREALFHFSALFDMFEATVARENKDRMSFEKEIFGRDVMNVIACEGSERVERPETYKQWQARTVRAGFRQLPLDREIVEEVRAKVRNEYDKDFVVDEDGHWMLQGWKGRIIYAVSCWKSAKEY
ncbi:hypothetical protein U1Q18_033363 [Sarracenia purpurea var. burkii]